MFRCGCVEATSVAKPGPPQEVREDVSEFSTPPLGYSRPEKTVATA
jgi:hypothetical protein